MPAKPLKMLVIARASAPLSHTTLARIEASLRAGWDVEVQYADRQSYGGLEFERLEYTELATRGNGDFLIVCERYLKH